MNVRMTLRKKIRFRKKVPTEKSRISPEICELKSLLTPQSNILPFYTSSQNSNLQYGEVDSLKIS